MRAGTWVARSPLPSITPRLSLDKALDITRIYSVTGQLPLSYSMLVRVERCLDPVA